METVLNAAGGLGIFLLAMGMMTDGLKTFGGDRLKAILEGWTSSTFRGVLTGAMVTGIVQSSSAVTVMIIGFVNAGILSLRQALGVIFGANVGTTMTGWLVSLLGFGFKIESFALPIIALGMGLRVAVQKKQINGLGSALAGFGLFFLGLTILKDAFAGLALSFGTATLADVGAGSIAIFVLIGIAATVLTQSSSAAVALIITAASGSAIGPGAAAAAIIGANIGTTSTALFAAINATPNARRVAAGHIVFNVGTGIIALAILPLLLWGINRTEDLIGMSGQPAVFLALFHTVFNVLGLVIMVPFINPLSRRLERFFRTAEEDISRPHHLDNTLVTTPALAIPAISQELDRMHDLVCANGLTALEGVPHNMPMITHRGDAITQLANAVNGFVAKLRMEGMPQEMVTALAQQLRICRYLEEAAQTLPQVLISSIEGHNLADSATQARMQGLSRAARACLTACRPHAGDEDAVMAPDQAKTQFETAYQETKAELLRAAAAHHLPIDAVDRLLDATSRLRRMVEQLVKATDLLVGLEIGENVTISPTEAEPDHIN